jgi:hypothetical protein
LKKFDICVYVGGGADVNAKSFLANLIFDGVGANNQQFA